MYIIASINSGFNLALRKKASQGRPTFQTVFDKLDARSKKMNYCNPVNSGMTNEQMFRYYLNETEPLLHYNNDTFDFNDMMDGDMKNMKLSDFAKLLTRNLGTDVGTIYQSLPATVSEYPNPTVASMLAPPPSTGTFAPAPAAPAPPSAPSAPSAPAAPAPPSAPSAPAGPSAPSAPSAPAAPSAPSAPAAPAAPSAPSAPSVPSAPAAPSAPSAPAAPSAPSAPSAPVSPTAAAAAAFAAAGGGGAGGAAAAAALGLAAPATTPTPPVSPTAAAAAALSSLTLTSTPTPTVSPSGSSVPTGIINSSPTATGSAPSPSPSPLPMFPDTPESKKLTEQQIKNAMDYMNILSLDPTRALPESDNVFVSDLVGFNLNDTFFASSPAAAGSRPLSPTVV
jgi:hypothetical protein